MVNKSLRHFMLSILSFFPLSAFSCTFPGIYLVSMRNKNMGSPYIGGTTEEFLNQKYGVDAWYYDDELFISAPERVGNSVMVPMQLGIRGDSNSEDISELTIYAEEEIKVVNAKVGGGYPVDGSEWRGRWQVEARVFQIANYKFMHGAIPFASMRLNLSNGAATVRLFAVFTTAKSIKARVVRQPKAMNLEFCSAYVYLRDAFEIQPAQSKSGQAMQNQETDEQVTGCHIQGLDLSSEFEVFAAGSGHSSGRKLDFQIDQSGNNAVQLDVKVNYPDKPVVLMLEAYHSTIWNISWTKGTRILAVWADGHHRQAVSGLPKDVPIRSSYSMTRRHDPCGTFAGQLQKKPNLNWVDGSAQRAFRRRIDRHFYTDNGVMVIGMPVEPNTKLITSRDVTPESYFDKFAPLAGTDGLIDAMRKGMIRKATRDDLNMWSDEIGKYYKQRGLPEEIKTVIPSQDNAYVVLKQFTIPAGIASPSTFIIPKGVPIPERILNHFSIYDLNTLICRGRCS